MSESKIKTMKIQDFEIGETLGVGTFGRVKIAKNKRTGEFSAIKMLKKWDILNAKQGDHIINEINIISKLDHPFIVKFNGFSQDEKYLYIFLELVYGGELFTILRSAGILNAEQAKFYLAQIVCIFKYLHSKNIIYRNLLPENILINKDGYIKLVDFDFAKELKDNKTYTLCGTPGYLAPEVLLNKGHGKAADWWTLGVLLYEMIAGIDPFNDEDPMVTYNKILQRQIHFPSYFDPDAKSLVKHLLQIDLTKRFGNLKNGVRDITEHKFFKGFCWDKLLNKKLKPPYEPKVKGADDTSNFNTYPDSDEQIETVPAEKDKFIEYFK